MDPITAAIQLVIAIIDLHKTTLEGMTPEQRVTYGQFVLKDLERWHNTLDQIFDMFKLKKISALPEPKNERLTGDL
jgi:hypothetical protein